MWDFGQKTRIVGDERWKCCGMPVQIWVNECIILSICGLISISTKQILKKYKYKGVVVLFMCVRKIFYRLKSKLINHTRVYIKRNL